MENRFIRKQEDLHGMYVNNEGNVILHREDRAFNRNTCHFAVNGIVTDHVYGKFDGGLAIIADPKQMGTPSGLGQADVWFHHDANKELNIGRAVLVAPIGMKLPDGAKAIYYDSSIPNALENAVNLHLMSVDVVPQKIGMHGWTESDIDHNVWRANVANELYGADSSKIHLGQHDGSLDDSIDSAVNGCEAALKNANTEYLYANGSGIEVLYTDEVLRRIELAREKIAQFERNAPESVVVSASGYFKKLGNKLDKIETENAVLKTKFESPFFVQIDVNGANIGPLNRIQIERMIVDGQIGREALVTNICYPENQELAGVMFSDVKWPLVGVSLPPALLGNMPPPLPIVMQPLFSDIAIPPPIPQSIGVQADVMGLAQMIEESSQCMASAIPRDGLSAVDARDVVREDMAAFGLIKDADVQLNALVAIGRNADNQVNYQAELASLDKGLANLAAEVFAQCQRMELVRDGAFSGVILDISGGLVTQRVNREGDVVRHSISLLSAKVEIREVVDIGYKDGIGVVEGKGVGVDRGR